MRGRRRAARSDARLRRADERPWWSPSRQPSASSDVRVALELLARAAGAALNVQINLSSLKDANYVGQPRRRDRELDERRRARRRRPARSRRCSAAPHHGVAESNSKRLDVGRDETYHHRVGDLDALSGPPPPRVHLRVI